MMHVSTSSDGEREWRWMTAGLLCVHGAEQGETLYGTDQLSLSLAPVRFFFSHPLYTKSVLSGAVILYKSLLSPNSHTVTLK